MSVYTEESRLTYWFVGIIVALAFIAIGYLVFSEGMVSPSDHVASVCRDYGGAWSGDALTCTMPRAK